jgi:hypothetical protein
MRNETKTLNISFNELCAWQGFLEGKGDGTYNCVKKWTVEFEDGVEVDIKVCDGGPDGTPFVDPVIFHNGHEIGCLDADDTLAGEYLFHKCRDIDYIVIIPDTIELAKDGQHKYRIVEEWLGQQDNETLGMIDITTLATARGSVGVIDRGSTIEDVMERADHYEEILDDLFERATLQFKATGP